MTQRLQSYRKETEQFAVEAASTLETDKQYSSRYQSWFIFEEVCVFESNGERLKGKVIGRAEV